MEFGKRHDTTDNLLQTCYGETGVMGFGRCHALLIGVFAVATSYCLSNVSS